MSHFECEGLAIEIHIRGNKLIKRLATSMILLLCGPVEIQALETLAYFNTFTTTTGGTPTIPAGNNGATAYFSSITMTYAGLTPSTSTDPKFGGIPNVTNGNPAANYFQFAFVKQAAYLNYSFEITGIYLAPYKSVTPESDDIELHFYSNVGGFTTGTTNQLVSGGTGRLVASTDTNPPATITNLNGTAANRTIASGTSSYQIRMAPDRVASNVGATILFNNFGGTFAGYTLPNSNAIFVIVGNVVVPEPRTYVLAGVSVLACLGLEFRRRRMTRFAA